MKTSTLTSTSTLRVSEQKAPGTQEEEAHPLPRSHASATLEHNHPNQSSRGSVAHGHLPSVQPGPMRTAALLCRKARLLPTWPGSLPTRRRGRKALPERRRALPPPQTRPHPNSAWDCAPNTRRPPGGGFFHAEYLFPRPKREGPLLPLSACDQRESEEWLLCTPFSGVEGAGAGPHPRGSSPSPQTLRSVLRLARNTGLYSVTVTLLPEPQATNKT